MKRTLLLILILNILSSRGISQNPKIIHDSISSNEFYKKKIFDKVGEMPPLIKVEFYIDGKKIKKGFIAKLIFYNKTIARENKQFLLDLKQFSDNDSIYLALQYHQYYIYSNKFSYKYFNHGGTFIAGIVRDYTKEKNKYLSDTSSYFNNNKDNYLYDIIGGRGNSYGKEYFNRNYQLQYSLVKSNNTYSISFKKEFIPQKLFHWKSKGK